MSVPAEKYFTREQLFAELQTDNVRGISKDIVAKANVGDPRALHHIGVEYDYFRKEYSKALGWYLMSAELNHPAAQESVGFLYERGHGVPVHFHIAMEWYLKAAKQKNIHSFIKIGDLFLKGMGVPLSKEKGLEWHFKYGEQSKMVTNAKDKGDYCLSQEQEKKPLDTLIQETEEILQYSIYRSLSYEGYKSIKANESSLIGNIQILQSSNNVMFQMHEEMNRKLTDLQSERKNLRESMELNAKIKEKDIRELQAANRQFNMETQESMKKRTQLTEEKKELQRLLKKEKEDRIKDVQVFQEKIVTEFALKREELNLQLQQEKKTNAALEKLLEEERESKVKYFLQLQEKLKEDSREKQGLEAKVMEYKSKIKELQRVVMDNRFEREQLEKFLEQEKAKKRDSFQLLSQLHQSFEKEKSNMNVVMEYMQTSKNNLCQSTQKISKTLNFNQQHEEGNQLAAAVVEEVVVVEEKVVTKSKAKANVARAVIEEEEEEEEERSLNEFKKKQNFSLHRPLLSQSVLLIRKELDYASEMRRKKRKSNAIS